MFRTITATCGLLVLWGCNGGEQEAAQENEPEVQPAVTHTEEPAVHDTEEEITDSPEPETAITADPPFEFDFSNGSMEDWDFGFDDFDVGFDEPQPLPPFSAITLEQFDAGWQTSLTASGQPAGELLTPLVEECGFTWEEQPEFAEALATPVDVELAGVSRLQVIEEICQQAGLYPRYTLDRFKVAEGPRPLPITFVGPFLVEVRELTAIPPHGLGSLAVQITGATMSTDFNSWLQKLSDIRIGSPPIAAIDAVRGTSDVDLVDDSGSFYANPAASRQVVRARVSVGLKNMLRSVEEIERLSGNIAIQIPTEVFSHQFTELAPGQSVESDGLSIEISSADSDFQPSLSFKIRGNATDDMLLVPYDSDGNELQVVSRLSTSLGDESELNILMEGEPASAEIRIVTATADLAYPFEFADIPLPLAAEMVAEIEPLTFSGDAPVTLTYLRMENDEFGQPAYVLEAVNHTNKDLSTMQIDVHFLDANGTEIDSFPQGYIGEPIPAGETMEIQIPTFFAPEETVSIRPELIELRAVDATTWKADD